MPTASPRPSRIRRPAAAVALLAACACIPFAAAAPSDFDRVDTNDDARVSSGEYEVEARRVFDAMDADVDDRLTTREIMANEAAFVGHVFTTGNLLGPAELTTAEKVQRLDANGDGLISQTEFEDGAAARFQHLDRNHNGELSPDEYATGK